MSATSKIKERLGIEQEKREMDPDGRVRGCGVHLPPLTYQKYIYMGKISHWKLAEGLLYNQGCEKGPHITAQEGKKGDQFGTCAPREETQRKGRIQK